ncbi:SNF5/SMARCB 1/INI1 family protein [Rhizoctonia solani]|uniref:SNF5/SMARCB 1/INI1 family protein n=1 Tax=Rhizoctonia solani TaxID=456999 RepID=A0A8H8PC01_9AGAM|nr:SNF5/SMARCB 1/INI1 family protein [Rhizoctonia solani]QRW27092.1 SNF5/SMARCB 1/INI1 family protein [Rhizoctonia solani]
MSSTVGARQWNSTYPPTLPTHAQAIYTSYHSRARTGSTLLMQPLGLAPVPPNHNPTQPPPTLTHAASFGPSRRTRGGVVNYAEMEDDEDENVDVEGESSGPALVVPTGISTGSRTSGELDRNYLGAIPPAKFIHPQKATRIQQEYFSEARLAEAASKRAIYIPVRLELNTESHQIRDSFLWNINDQGNSIQNESADANARQTHVGVADPDQAGIHPRDPRIEALRAELHGSSLVSGQTTPGTGIATTSISTSAASPASDGHVTPAPISVNIDDELDPMNDDGQKNQTLANDDKQGLTPVLELSPSNSKSQDKPTTAGETEKHSESDSDSDSESDYETDSEVDEPDCRVIVNLDLQISTHHLHDHIEWDLTSSLTPEHFARVLCADVGLAGEAVSLVACALREALLKHTKDALEAGLIGPGAHDSRSEPLGTAARKDVGPETLRSILRDWQDAEEYFPRLELLSAEELERRAMERERAIRRMRRETQRWGQANVSRKRFRER